jgi:putative endonuclease
LGAAIGGDGVIGNRQGVALAPILLGGLMAYVYLLECVDGSFYTGSTINLERRLWEHRSGLGAKHTRSRLPVRLVFAEFYGDVGEAFAREKQIQGGGRDSSERFGGGGLASVARTGSSTGGRFDPSL